MCGPCLINEFACEKQRKAARFALKCPWWSGFLTEYPGNKAKAEPARYANAEEAIKATFLFVSGGSSRLFSHLLRLAKGSCEKLSIPSCCLSFSMVNDGNGNQKNNLSFYSLPFVAPGRLDGGMGKTDKLFENLFTTRWVSDLLTFLRFLPGRLGRKSSASVAGRVRVDRIQEEA